MILLQTCAPSHGQIQSNNSSLDGFSKTNICTLVLSLKEIKLYFLSEQKTKQIKANVPKSDIGTVNIPYKI